MTTPNSATGGYLVPASTTPFPNNLSLEQFLQTVLVGISGFDGTLVRAKWQQKPPKMPTIDVDWFSFGVINPLSDTNAYIGTNADGTNSFQRQQAFEVACTIYGPNAFDTYNLICDGFQINQNLEVLLSAGVAFVNTGVGIHAPELIDELYYNRYDFSIYFRRQIQRVYSVLPLVSANGTIQTILGDEQYILDWAT